MLALAPMQEVTDGAFWTLIHRYGGADVYWTEYFRVHSDSTPEKRILDSIIREHDRAAVIAQMIGNDIPALVRTAKVLQQLPIAAIDLNLGCPAPIVYRKCAGGGLLREPRAHRCHPRRVARRGADPVHREDPPWLSRRSEEFDELLSIFAKHSLDALTVHARTVAQMYRLPVHYDRIRQAVEAMPCPVIANGHVYSAAQARDLLTQTGSARPDDRARRDPQSLAVQPDPPAPARRAVSRADRTRRVGYIRALWDSQASSTGPRSRSASG